MSKPFVCLVVLVTCVASAVIAAEPAETPPREISPIMEEIQLVLAQCQDRIATLEFDLERAPDQAAALQILREIQQQKQDAEVGVLRVQKRYALADGNLAAADEIDAVIERILAPEPVEASAEARAEREARRQEADHD
jgi:DnaJ-domain-containing protein 1